MVRLRFGTVRSGCIYGETRYGHGTVQKAGNCFFFACKRDTLAHFLAKAGNWFLLACKRDTLAHFLAKPPSQGRKPLALSTSHIPSHKPP